MIRPGGSPIELNKHSEHAGCQEYQARWLRNRHDGQRPGGAGRCAETAREVHGRQTVDTTDSATPLTHSRALGWSFKIAQVGQALLDDSLLFGGVVECAAMRAVQRLLGWVVTGRGEIAPRLLRR
jgi:hypothetical protein